MTTTYEQERAKGLAYVRRQCDEWRREVGMRPRHLEVNCPDEFTDWEPSWPLAHPAEPTPIWDAVVATLGEPPL